MEPDPSSQVSAASLSEIDDVIAGIVRGKLRVSLRADDGRQENQNALEIVSEARLEVLRKLRSNGSEIRNLRDYASTVTYHACAEHLRGIYAGRFRVQYKLRYFLSHHIDFRVWEREDSLVCGLAAWESSGRKAADATRIASARESSSGLRTAAAARVSADEMKAGDWEKLSRAVLEYLEGPVPFQAFVGIVAWLLGVENFEADELPDPVSMAPSPESTASTLELLRALWVEILLLDLRWRRAFLLNPPRDVELEVFPENGIASFAEIGSAVALEDREYEVVWSGLNVESQGAAAAERFRLLWEWLPLRDLLIARLLECEVQQVINLRRLARDRLADRLAPRMKRIRGK
jgi:hypothetical protein